MSGYATLQNTDNDTKQILQTVLYVLTQTVFQMPSIRTHKPLNPQSYNILVLSYVKSQVF